MLCILLSQHFCFLLYFVSYPVSLSVVLSFRDLFHLRLVTFYASTPPHHFSLFVCVYLPACFPVLAASF